ncbi:hypothetical protein MTR_8g469620 [Medicago truncatula]|uniref:Uncharacterized protein n=1 Tax=Medicago truncatula TaxID=3880 RepID=G7ZUN9_MEDTR|nr:hypothetical protein MTR_8g469620 [Medicago truncatula]
MKLAALSDDFVWLSLQSTDSVGSLPKMEGRTVYYHVAEDNGDVFVLTTILSKVHIKGPFGLVYF